MVLAPEPKGLLQKALDAGPKLIAVGTFLALLFTVIHEAGYFSVYGPHLQTLATTYDYFINALIWLPSSISILLFFTAVETIVSQAHEKRWSIGTTAASNLVIVALFSLLIFFLGGSFAWSITWALGITAVWLGAHLLPQEMFHANRTAYKLTVYLPAALVFAYGYGIGSANKDLRNTEHVYRIVYNQEDNATRFLVVLRSFEKGLLFHDPTNQRVEFVRWDVIRSISRVAPTKDEPSYACKWFTIGCSSEMRRIP